MRLSCQKHANLCTLEHSRNTHAKKIFIVVTKITILSKVSTNAEVQHEIICHNTLDFKTNIVPCSIIYAKVQFMPLQLLLLNYGIP